MSFKKTFIFLLILLLLGGYYYVVEVRMAKKKEAVEEAEKKLFDVQKDDIQEIVLRRNDQEILLKKQNDLWKMEQPVAASADSPNVERLLTQLVEAEREKHIAEKSDNDQEFDLDKPELSITVTTQEADKTLGLTLGKETPTASGYYARVTDSSAVITVATALKTALDKTEYDLRDKTLLSFNTDDISKVELVSEEETITITRESSEKWKNTQPGEFTADSSTVQNLLSDAGNVEVKEFIVDEPGDLSIYGLDVPGVTLRVWETATDEPQQLLLGGTNEENTGVYAKLGEHDSVVLVEMNTREQLQKNAFDLRYKKIVAFEQDQIKKIQLRYTDSTLLIEKDGGQWKSLEPEKQNLQTYKVNNLLFDLKDLEFKEESFEATEDLSKYGLTDPYVTVTLWQEKDQEIVTLLFGEERGNPEELYVKIPEKTTIYPVDSAILNELPKNIIDLVE